MSESYSLVVMHGLLIVMVSFVAEHRPEGAQASGVVTHGGSRPGSGRAGQTTQFSGPSGFPVLHYLLEFAQTHVH